jgi:DNA-binding winged helix-turn-helix (wHTH) protein/TolB-like protein
MDVLVREQGVYAFASFRLDPVRRELLRNGVRVPIGTRQFDTLLYLVANHGRLVEREELQRAVWRGRAVDESSLAVAISNLRKILQADGPAENFIVTVTGHGYSFGAKVVFEPEALPQAASASPFVGAPAVFEPPAPAVVVPAPTVPPQARRPVPFIIVCIVLLAGGAAAALWHFSARPSPPPLSIVVMPFRAIGPADGRAFYADQVTDDLDADLRSIPRSVVIERSSAAALAGRPPREIGSALSVRYLVEGSVQDDAGAERINVRLIDTESGIKLSLEPDDFSIPANSHEAVADLARRIANALDVRLVDAEVARAAQERPNESTALDQFLRARSLIDRSAELPDLQTAQHLLELSRKTEPDAVETLSLLGGLLVYKMQNFEYSTFAQDLDEAREVVADALKRAPRNAAALAAHGWLELREGRNDDAEAAFEAALSAEPHNLQALDGAAKYAWYIGAPEKMAPPLNQALLIDPLGPAAKKRHYYLGLAALFTGQAQAAIHDLLLADDAAADHPGVVDSLTPAELPRIFLVAAYQMSGNSAEAQRRYQAYRRIWKHRTVWRLQAFLLQAQRNMPGCARVFDALQAAGMPRTAADEKDHDNIPPSSVALVGEEYTPTPNTLPGAETINAVGLARLMTQNSVLVILDRGRGIAVPRGAIMVSESPNDFTQPAMTEDALAKTICATGCSAIVVMDTGSASVDGYNLGLHIIKLGRAPVYWYRGGEEDWAFSGQPSVVRSLN